MFLRSPTKQVYILLGRKCNFNCRYCTQLNKIDRVKELPTEINDDIFSFIEQLTRSNIDPIGIQLYGGEPLLYFDKIKYIVEKLKPLQESGKIEYSTMTNGSFSKEQVQYFNDNNLEVGISWDGHQKYTRGHDIFEENKENILNLRYFHVSGVISSYCYPKQLMDDFQDFDNQYFNYTGRHVRYFLIDEVYDSGLLDRTLFDIDYNRVHTEMTEIVDKAFDDLLKNENIDSNWVSVDFMRRHINFLKNVTNGKDTKGFNNISPDKICYCGNGYWVYNIDLEGNLYTCHNNNYIAGTIYDNYWSYLANVMRDDKTEYFYNKMCGYCKAYPLCLGGCKHISEEVRRETYCRLQRAFFLPIINKVLRYAGRL